jgi:hypothetical protein
MPTAQSRSRRRKNGRWQLNAAAASALTGLLKATLRRYLDDRKIDGEIETGSDGRQTEWYDDESLIAWNARRALRTTNPDPKHAAHSESSRMKKGRRQINAAAASALTGHSQAYLSLLLLKGELKGKVETSNGHIRRAWYNEKHLKKWHEQRTGKLKTTDPELKEKLAEHDLILYPDAQEYCKLSQTAMDRVVKKNKLHKEKVTLVDAQGKHCRS